MSARQLKLALCQATAGRTLDECVHVAEDAIAQASAKGCRLVQFSELFFPGYGNSTDVMCRAALDLSDPTQTAWFNAVALACRSHEIYAAVGYAEHNSENPRKPFNSVLIVSPAGTVVANHRKTHLWSDYEGNIFTPGNTLGPLVKIDGIKVGLVICFEVEFPEIVRTLTLAGAELILAPTALTNPFNAQVTVPSRAAENNVFIGYCNDQSYQGDDTVEGPRAIRFAGLSCVCEPTGHDLLRFGPSNVTKSGMYGLDTCVVAPDADKYKECKRRNPYLESRRPELYNPDLVATIDTC